MFLSRLAAKKGLARLVDAFARLAPTRPELDLVLVGPDEGGERARVEARVARLGMATRVRFAGAAAAADKSDWLAHAEALVLPSDDENFGVVVVEAAHLGAPLVVSDRVGLAPDVLELGAGRVTARTPEAIAAALDDVLTRGRAAFAVGTAALAARFAWGPTLDRLEALYRRVARANSA